MVTVLALTLALLCLVAVISAVIAAVRDSRRPVPTVWGYDTRRPLP